MKFHTPRPPKGQSILKVASQYVSVPLSCRVEELADALTANPQIMAVGVTNPQGIPLGLITRAGLFSQLGRAFGREVLGRKTLEAVMTPAPVFNADTSLFHVADQLSTALDQKEIAYFLLADGQGQFEGIFSSQDLLLFLSRVVQADIELAGHLQERLMYGALDWKEEGLKVEGFSFYAKGVGGDFYHIHKVSPGVYFLALCDVSGKGVAASFITALLWGMIRMYDFAGGLKNLIQKINESLIRTFHLEKYVTGYFMTLDVRTGKLVWADMGHSHAYLRRGTQVKALRGEKLNLPVGLDAQLDPVLYATTLHPGQQAVFFTDGLVEQLGALGQEFGEDRLLVHFKKGPDFLEGLKSDFTQFKGDRSLHDDTTVLTLTFTGAPVVNRVG